MSKSCYCLFLVFGVVALAASTTAQYASAGAVRIDLGNGSGSPQSSFQGAYSPIYTIASGGSAWAGSLLFTPQFSDSDQNWDTEQFAVGTPMREQIVAEGRIGNRGVTGDREYGINTVGYAGTFPNPFFGNPVPNGSPSSGTGADGSPFSYTRYVTDGLAAGQLELVSSVTYRLRISYDAGTRELGMAMWPASLPPPPADVATFPIDGLTGTGPSQTRLALLGQATSFDDILLRVNVSNFGSTSGAAGTRTLSLTNLTLQVGTGLPQDLQRDFGGVSVNSVVASATGTTSTQGGQRQLVFWDNVVSDAASFQLLGDVVYTWSTSTAPTGSSMAFQFKFGRELALVPEPAAAASLFAVLGLLLVARRRRR